MPICMMRSRSPAGLRSQPHYEFNKIIKYLSAPVALLSVHASFKNFADNRVAEIAFADASLRGIIFVCSEDEIAV
jgi:hypothetical protein